MIAAYPRLARRRVVMLAPVLASMLALTGCIGLGGKPPAQFLTLTPAAYAPAGAPLTATPVVVNEPETAQMLATTRLPVALAGGGVAYLKDAVWVDRPARLFRALLAETIRADSHHLVIEEGAPELAGPGGAHLRLSGRLEALGYDAPSHSVVVRFDALRTLPDGTLAGRRFEATEADVAPDAGAVAPALNRAAGKLARDVAGWLDAG